VVSGYSKLQASVLLLAALLVGCASTGSIIDRHAIIQNDAGGQGSAACIGEGLVLTSEHILFNESGEYLGGRLFFRDLVDSNFSVVLLDGGIVLLGSRIAASVSLVALSPLTVGTTVLWVQPFSTKLGIYSILMQGIVSGFIAPDEYLLDRETWPGSSGSGVYTSDGKLVGLIFGYLGFRSGTELAYFGMANPIPDGIRTLIEAKPSKLFGVKQDVRVH